MMNNVVVITQDKDVGGMIKKAAEGIVKISAECRTLKEAIDVFRREPAKLVIIDFFHGESGSLESIKTLKKMDETLTIVLISRLRGRDVLDKAFRYGAGDVLLYPCQAETLRHTLLHRLERMEDNTYVFADS